MVLKKLLAEFPGRNWSLASVKCLLHQIDTTGSADHKTGSGRRRSARTDGNPSVVEELALSQKSRHLERTELCVRSREKHWHYQVVCSLHHPS